MILITGATGKTGGAVAAELGKRGITFRAIVRDANKAKHLLDMGGELCVGNLADREFLDTVLEGVTKAFLVLPNVEDQEAMEMQFVDACAAKGGIHLVYLSSMESIPGCTTTVTKMHVRTEEHIRASGLPYTMIRPTFFMQLFIASAAKIKETGNIVMPTANGTVVPTDVRDVAEVIVNVLTEDGHENQSYDITGPELITLGEVAARFSKVLGREIKHVSPPLDAYADVLRKVGFPEWRVEAVSGELGGIAAGMIDHKTETMGEMLGRPPRKIDDFVADYAELFK
jgi:uncharacterized protein YbjT (DUF2867 family)